MSDLVKLFERAQKVGAVPTKYFGFEMQCPPGCEAFNLVAGKEQIEPPDEVVEELICGALERKLNLPEHWMTITFLPKSVEVIVYTKDYMKILGKGKGSTKLEALLACAEAVKESDSGADDLVASDTTKKDDNE